MTIKQIVLSNLNRKQMAARKRALERLNDKQDKLENILDVDAYLAAMRASKPISNPIPFPG